MKKTQFIDLITIIKKNIVAFVSVCLFVSLAVAIFLGIGFSSTATLKIADNIADNANFHDLNILYPYGFSEDDINTIESLNDSYTVEGYYYAYEYIKVDGNLNQISVNQISEKIDILYDIEGTLPVSKGEIALDKTTASNLGIKIGDVIAFEDDNSENLELINRAINFDSKTDDVNSLMEEETKTGYLTTYTYKVTALVSKPTMMHQNKNMFGVAYTNGLGIDGFMFVSEDSFKKEAFVGYPGILIKDETLNDYSLFSDEYKDGVNALKSNVETAIASITENKNTLVLSSIDEVIDAADDKLYDGEKQINDGEKRISDGEQKIADGEKQITSNSKKISVGKSQINSAQKTINNSESQINESEKLLEEANAQIEDGKKQISDGENQINDAEKQITEYEEKIETAETGIEIAQEYIDEFNTKFSDSDEVVDSLREGREKINEMSKDELVSLMKEFINGTYRILNKQGYEYSCLAKYEIVDKDLFYSKINKPIPSTKGGTYIANYLSNHEDVKNNFYYDVDEEIMVGDEYVEYVSKINEILAKEEKDEDDFDDINDNIEYISNYNDPESYMNGNTKTIILDTILEDYYNDSDEETLRSTINYLFDEYDAYKEDYNTILSFADKAKEKLNTYKTKLDESKKQVEAAKQELDSKKQELNDGINSYNENKAKLDNAKVQLANAKSKLESSKSELNGAIVKLNNAINELNNFKKQLNDAKEELEDAKKEYEESKLTVDDFKEKRDSIKSYEATYTTGLDSSSIHSFRAISEILNKVKYTMAGLFLVIGLLVCYFSILRMVNEHIKLIGTKKALGFYTREITKTYILFTGISSILGCIIGVLIGYFLVQKTTMTSIISATTYNGLILTFNGKETVLICLMEVILLVLITYGATTLILKENAVVLLAGPKPPSGKPRFYEKFSLWKKISLFNKTIINNCVADKRRVLGTLIGVCGCTALVVTAFTLNNCLTKNFNKQFGEYFGFDSIVYYSNDSAKEELNEILDKYNVSSVNVLKTYTIIKDDDGGSLYSFLIVPEDIDDFKEIVDIDPMTNKNSDPYTGLWITYSYKNVYKDINDEFEFTTLSGANARVKASGYFAYYLNIAQMFMDKESYTEINDGEYSTNAILIDTSDVDLESLSRELQDVDGFIKLEDFKGLHKEAFDITKNLATTIVGIYAILSFLMAILVLLNLYTMFVMEKKKELITLMINGYSIKVTKKYISKDTVLLTIVGIALGIGLGTVFGFISIDTFNTYTSYVYKEIDIPACLIGAANSGVLSYIMCKIALRKVDKFKMSDINN